MGVLEVIKFDNFYLFIFPENGSSVENLGK